MRAVLCGYYGQGNGGDEALLASLLQMLPASVEPIVLSGNPAQTKKRYGVQTCDRKSFGAVLQALRQSQAFIWGGGSLMQDVTSAASPFYYGGLMGLAQQMGLTTIAWAQGIGPLNRQATRWVTRQALKGCHAISVRDEGSARLLLDWQLPNLMAPDPVWALEAKPVQGLWDLPAPRIAVALRPHPLLTSDRLTQITRALGDLQKATEACVLLVPFQPGKDLAIAEAIQPHLPGPNQIVTLEDPQELKGLFRGVEMTIAMRFHGLIMAAAEGCRCFAISYDPKVSQLMVEVGLSGWELADMPNNPHEISHSWLECYANGDPLSAHRIQALTDRALLHRDLLAEVLES
ncbi:MAG: polysaccharide pyruvyl transferase CsaB [Leptolyngbyaceae cyanobacterium bins.59]|nr:polysaccharide pyruvyl transferase CsaB [Leptolyngbyaceae cyanobacterium bins.59]